MTDKKFYIAPNRRTVIWEMKAILVFIFVFLLSTNIYGQAVSHVDANINTNMNAVCPNNDISFDYKQTSEWQKYKKLKIWGWTTFGVGGAMVVGGCIGDAIDNYEYHKDGTRIRFRVVWCIGIGVTVASIPMITLAYKNKRKAKNLSLAASSLSVDLPNGSRQAQPALGLCLHF